jgi:hypothetical protein
MLFKDNPNATGKLQITLTRANGAVEHTNVDNLVVDTGLNYIVSRMKDTSLGVMSHMAVGEGTTTAVGADAALELEIGRAALVSTVVSDNYIVYNATFVPGVGTGAITEAGIFNANTGGTMLARTVFPVVNKQTADTLSITWTITIS